MRTYSQRYVKHFSRNARGIHHSLRDFCQDRRMRGDAHDIVRSTRASTRTTLMTTLSDGTYDAFIIWAEQRDGDVVLECTITAGERRGDVVNIVTSSFVARDPLSLVGLACTLIVRDNEIRVAQ